MSSSRNPKDLRQIVSASQSDMDEMLSNLSKLKSLSADDKTENALLRSRIDEQSQLIMILKQRTDESVIKLQTLARINKELEDFRDSATEELKMQLKKFNILDSRFHDLASNHQEMILIKDEYKRRNEDLRKENAKLMKENSQLFSTAIEERDNKILELESKSSQWQEKGMFFEQKNRELADKLKRTEENHIQDCRRLKKEVEDAEERLKGVLSKVRQLTEGQEGQEEESSRKVQLLTKEKDELLTLAMHRGKLIQEKQTENKKLQQKIEALDKNLRDMQDKFERESAAVNVNVHVRRLKAELEDGEDKYKETIREFDAYKKHSTELLQREKDLNMKLRHLIG